MKSTPLILVTASTQKRGAEFSDASLSLSLRYTQAIQAAGGLPCILPDAPNPEQIQAYVRRCDGVMLTGGDDVQPRLYQASVPPHLQPAVSSPDPRRDLMELQLIEVVFQQQKPLLAICRGQQILNVALGGSLLVDIARQKPGAMNHCRSRQKDQLVHEVVLTSGSLLSTMAHDARLKVNSSHHQAVDRVARPLRATAVSPDGIIEGLELAPAATGLLPFLLAVQFHPERLFDRYPEFLLIFRNFVSACKPRRGK